MVDDHEFLYCECEECPLPVMNMRVMWRDTYIQDTYYKGVLNSESKKIVWMIRR